MTWLYKVLEIRRPPVLEHGSKVSTQPGPDGSASFGWCPCGWRGPVHLGMDQQDEARVDADVHVLRKLATEIER